MTQYLWLRKDKNPKGTELNSKLCGTPARGTNTPICPMKKKQFIHPCDRKTLNEDNVLSTVYPQFHDDWM